MVRRMEYRFLGRTGVRVSSLCLGTMAFGKEADASTATAIYERCKDAGINTFDCADVYAGGHAEEILGRLVSGHRDEVVLMTKGYFPTGADLNARGSTRYHLVRAVEASLRRLQTDRIDVYFLHRFDDATPLEDTLRTLELLVSQGKILYPAVSNFAAWQTAKAIGLQAAHHYTPMACVQPMYNLVKRQAEAEILDMCATEGLGVFCYSPLGGGLLSGKYGRSARPDQGRLVENEMYQARYGAASDYEIAEKFTALAAELGVHPATLAVRWCATHPAVTAPIIGARNLEQLEPLLAAAELDLGPDLRARVSALSPEPPPATDRNEERAGHTYGAR